MQEYIQKAINIILLKDKSINEVSRDSKATNIGILFLVFAILVELFVSSRIRVIDFKQEIIFYIVILFLFFVSVHLTAKLIGSHKEFINFFRPYCFASLLVIIGIITLIPVAGNYLQWIIMIWGQVINFVIINTVYDLRMWKTLVIFISSIILPIILYSLISWAGINLGFLAVPI